MVRLEYCRFICLLFYFDLVLAFWNTSCVFKHTSKVISILLLTRLRTHTRGSHFPGIVTSLNEVLDCPPSYIEYLSILREKWSPVSPIPLHNKDVKECNLCTSLVQVMMVFLKKQWCLLRTPNTKFSAQRKFNPEGKRTGNKRQRQKIKDGMGEGRNKRGRTRFLSQRSTDSLWIQM